MDGGLALCGEGKMWKVWWWGCSEKMDEVDIWGKKKVLKEAATEGSVCVEKGCDLWIWWVGGDWTEGGHLMRSEAGEGEGEEEGFQEEFRSGANTRAHTLASYS